jgi:limonene-1,2-epoxide hydrolase
MTRASHDPIEVVRTLLDALDAGDFRAVRELLAPDFRTVPVSTGTPMGLEAWLAVHEELHRCFPDLRRRPRDFRADGDRVMVTLHITARNTEPIRLPQLGIDELPATGIELHPPPHTDTFTVRDGKVTGVHSDIPPGGGLRGMLDEIRRAAAPETRE